tara:strand:- start:615 stop:911 length:297 start_codon:yes stop_codon:yes gene_type:complete
MMPKVLEDIIIDYKNQMEHKEKFEKSLEEIQSINYGIINGTSTIIKYQSSTKPEKMKVVFNCIFDGKLKMVIRGQKYYNVLFVPPPKRVAVWDRVTFV